MSKKTFPSLSPTSCTWNNKLSHPAQYTEELDADGNLIKNSNLSSRNKDEFFLLEERVKQAEAVRKVHQQFRQLIEEKNMHSMILQTDTRDSSKHKSLLVFHNYEMNDLKWGMLMQQYPASHEDILEFTNTFRSCFVFDYLGIYDNLFAFGMQVKILNSRLAYFYFKLFYYFSSIMRTKMYFNFALKSETPTKTFLKFVPIFSLRNN